MKIIDKFLSICDVAARWLASISTAVMWVVMCYAVIMRYIFTMPPVWGDELCRYCLVWMTFYGGAVALRKRSLANMTLLVDALPVKVRKWVNVLVGIACVVLLASFTVWSVKLTMARSVTIQKTPAMRLPMPLIYSCMPVSLGLMTLQQTMLVWKDILEKPDDKKGEVLQA